MVAFIDAHRDRWPVLAICTTIEMPERSYYAAKVRALSARPVSDAVHRPHIRRVWEDNYRCYGASRVHKQLRREGYKIARCTIVRLMDNMGIHGVQRGKKHFTTVPDATAARPPGPGRPAVRRRGPNQLWRADITHGSTWQGWLYVSFILDVYSRTIAGWQIADHLRTGLVLDALEMAIWRRDPSGGGLVHQSDAGCQYGSPVNSSPYVTIAQPGPPHYTPTLTNSRRARCHRRHDKARASLPGLVERSTKLFGLG